MNRLIILLVCLLLTGCISQPGTPTPTPTSQLTPTVLAILPTSAETVHHWDAQPVLAQLYRSAGYTSDLDAWAILPAVVVYADGRVITTRHDSQYLMHAWSGTIKFAHISHDELCSLLAKIDRSGFFDFNVKDYAAPDITDQGSTDIIVNAWRSNSVSAYAFGALSGDPAALVEPYHLLLPFSYSDRTTPYQVERLALLVRPWGTTNYSPLNPWPAVLPPLKKIAPSGGQTVSILTGQDITKAYEFFADRGRLYVSEDGLSYEVAIRPLLPLEIPAAEPWSPSKFEESPKVSMTCDSSVK